MSLPPRERVRDAGVPVPSPRTVRDAALLVAPVVVLFALAFLVPRAVQNAFAFRHASPNPVTLYTAAFFHLSREHLLANAFAYLVAVGVAYRLSRAAGALGWFRGAALVQLTATPVLVNATSWVLVASWYPALTPVSRGFSGVVAGFVGVAVVALARYAETAFDHAGGFVVGLAGFVVVWVAADFQQTGRVRPVAVAVLVGAVGVVLASQAWRRGLDTGVDVHRAVGVGTVVVGAGAAIVVLALGLFPAPAARTPSGYFVDVYAHAAGVLWGVETAVLLRAA